MQAAANIIAVAEAARGGGRLAEREASRSASGGNAAASVDTRARAVVGGEGDAEGEIL